VLPSWILRSSSAFALGTFTRRNVMEPPHGIGSTRSPAAACGLTRFTGHGDCAHAAAAMHA
jgi:hypothetical protein